MFFSSDVFGRTTGGAELPQFRIIYNRTWGFSPRRSRGGGGEFLGGRVNNNQVYM